MRWKLGDARVGEVYVLWARVTRNPAAPMDGPDGPIATDGWVECVVPDDDNEVMSAVILPAGTRVIPNESLNEGLAVAEGPFH